MRHRAVHHVVEASVWSAVSDVSVHQRGDVSDRRGDHDRPDILKHALRFTSRNGGV